MGFCAAGLIADALERFRAKWVPLRVKKTRQNKKREPRSDSIGTEKALARWILRIRSLDIIVEHARSRRVATALGEGEHLEHADTTVERDGQHIALLDAMPGRLLADAVDPDTAGLDQSGGAAAGFYHARVP
jgi:hypothetical protein